MKDFNKTAHMSAFKIMRKIYIQIDRSRCQLKLICFIQYSYRIFYISHTDFLKRNFSSISFILNITHTDIIV